MSKFLKIGARIAFPGPHSPEFMDDAIAPWKLEIDFPDFQLFHHQEVFLTPHDWEVKKSPGKQNNLNLQDEAQCLPHFQPFLFSPGSSPIIFIH